MSDFISHPNTRTLHRGDRENGPSCGQQSDSWATVDAENPLEAVLDYATPPCSKCFKHTGRLNAVYKDKHTATVVYADIDDVIRLLPWNRPTNTDK